MPETREDYRKVVAGSVTSSGKVTHVYGGNIDWVVFLTDEPEAKCLFNAGTPSGNLAVEEILPLAKKLNLEAFQKLDKANWFVNLDVLSSCLVSAFSNPGSTDRAFQPYRDFISKSKKTKTIFGKGPNPQHIVYMNEDNNVAWEFREDAPAYMQMLLSTLNDLRQVSKRVFPKFIREQASVRIGSAALTIVRSGLKPDKATLKHLNKTVANAVADVESDMRTVNGARYSFTVLAFALIPALWIYFDGFNYFSAGISGGIAGSLLFSFERSKGELTRSQYSTLFLQALTRVLVGATYGTIVVALSKSGLALSLFSENTYALFIFGVISGYFERWIPNLLVGVAKSSAENNP